MNRSPGVESLHEALPWTKCRAGCLSFLPFRTWAGPVSPSPCLGLQPHPPMGCPVQGVASSSPLGNPVLCRGGPPGDTVRRQTPPHHCSEPLIHSFSGRTGVWMRARLLTSALLVPTWGPSHAVTSGRWLSLLGLERPPLQSKNGAERPQGSSGNETSSLAQSRSSICGSC